MAETPLHLTKQQIGASMATAFEPFREYIEQLAQGKLDGYLNSNRREDKVLVPEMKLSNDPNLLLHDVGKSPEMKKEAEQLFVPDTMYVI